MRRSLINVLAVFSLGLFLANLALGASRLGPIHMLHFEFAGEDIVLYAYRSQCGASFRRNFVPDLPVRSVHCGDLRQAPFAFSYMRGRFPNGPTHRELLIGWHWWAAAIAFSLPLAFRLDDRRRRVKCARRATKGLCVHCGYDLRATPDKCPECGTVPEMEKPANTAD
jgi:hypothetical protein